MSEAELDAFRHAAHALVDGVADHLAALPSQPVWQPLPDALRERLLDLPLPERAAALDDLVATALGEAAAAATDEPDEPPRAGALSGRPARCPRPALDARGREA